MFSSYTRRRHKKKYARNKCSKFLLMSFLKFFNCRRGMWLCKRKVLKNGQTCKKSKTMGTQMPAMKKERKKKKERKDSPCSLAKVFSKFQTRETCFNEHSRIMIATIYIYSTHMHILIKIMTSFSLDPCFDFTIYTMQVCFHFHPT
jgi:hypothetical protein